MKKYTFRFEYKRQIQKRGIRVEAENAQKAYKMACEIFYKRHPETKGQPLLAIWHYV